jgi:hypothetical protein
MSKICPKFEYVARFRVFICLGNRVSTINEIRQKNLQLLARQYEHVTQFSKQAGVGNSQIDQMLKNREPIRNLGEKLARRIEANMGLPPGWMDSPHEDIGAFVLPLPGEPVRYPAHSRAPDVPRSPLVPSAPCSTSPMTDGNEYPRTPDADTVNLAGLDLLRKAAITTLVRLARNDALSDRECVELLEAWKEKMS